MNRLFFYMLLSFLLGFTMICKGQVDTASTRGIYSITFDLTGRYIVRYPAGQEWNKEKGIVVVKITVDSLGKVIRAVPDAFDGPEPNLLKARARQAALQTVFNKSSKGKDQSGTITIGLGPKPKQ